ncbi:hypothetical protein AC578_1361 [Pseudocercospora eumusae]|uniref:Uncharacterized protein n=1 Tax=Pseudocercospora eumusae TaxID=321146 RepID=A0A139HUK6_9PEZI|nr:hypothetical protein AC578_1361 [Pseudocercospora eumusae]
MSVDIYASLAPQSQVSADTTSPDTQISPIDLTICHLKCESNFQNFQHIAEAINDIHGAGGTETSGDIEITPQECERRWQDIKSKFEAQTNANGEHAQYSLPDVIKTAIKAISAISLIKSTFASQLWDEVLNQRLTAVLNRGVSKRELIQAAMASCDGMNEVRRWWSITKSVNFVLKQFGRSITLLEARMLSGDEDYDPASEDVKLSSFEDPAVAVSSAAKKIRDLREENDELVKKNERLESGETIADLWKENAKLLARVERLERSVGVFAPAGMRPDFCTEETG